ncbi:T9SS type A sorting domain-containing protein [bacterium]|nr:T9SS type A sorting domain-containing protein [bacterium]
MKRLSMTLILLLGSTMIAFAWSFSDISNNEMAWDDVITAPGPYASCVAWGDVNGDGSADLFVGSALGNHSQLYLNSGNGRFTDVSDEWNTERFANIRSAQFVDYDEDGLLDLFLITDNPIPLELYRQVSGTRLVSVPLDLSPTDLTAVAAAVWSDIDSDGALEMIVNAIGDTRPEMTALVAEDNSMTLARDGLFPEGIEHVSSISMIDYNLDGHLDILAGSEAGRSKFYAYHRGEYQNIIADLGLAANVGGKGIAWADFDHNGYLDFATCGSRVETYLYMGCAVDRQIGFEDVLRPPHVVTDPHPLMPYIEGATSVHAVDVNMDGWTDLFYVNARSGNFLLLNNHGQGWTFDSHINTQLNCGTIPTTAAAWADVDADGDPDLALSKTTGGITLLMNQLNIQHEYLTIKLAEYTTDTPMLNCQVLVKFQNSARLWATTSMANSAVGYDNTVCQFVNPTTDHSRILNMTVIWPSGAFSVYDIDDLTLWGETVIRPPQLSPGDLNGDDNPDTFLEPQPALMATLNNTPNPFNPTTTLNYTVPEAGWVDLSVVNVLGQEVMSLVSGYAEAGVHSVHFDASTLPSGMYVARMNAAGQTMLHRMILTK